MEYTEEERQQLRNNVVEMCDSILEQYDWDGEFRRYLEGQ